MAADRRVEAAALFDQLRAHAKALQSERLLSVLRIVALQWRASIAAMQTACSLPPLRWRQLLLLAEEKQGLQQHASQSV